MKRSGHRKHILYKRLFFISKELQLTQWITVNRVIPYILETSDLISLALEERDYKGKEKDKEEEKEKE